MLKAPYILTKQFDGGDGGQYKRWLDLTRKFHKLKTKDCLACFNTEAVEIIVYSRFAARFSVAASLDFLMFQKCT